MPILLIGCSDPEQKASSAELERNVSIADPEWKTREFERKAKVLSLIKQLADDSQENQRAAFNELRDKYIRRRDIAELHKEIDRYANNDTPPLLLDLLILVDAESRWRLPNNVWISDLFKCATSWQIEIDNIGCEARVGYGPDDGLRLGVPYKSEFSTEVINLILELEPKILTLEGGDRESITNNAFLAELLGLMDDIEILISVDKGGKATDITPPKKPDRKAESGPRE